MQSLPTHRPSSNPQISFQRAGRRRGPGGRGPGSGWSQFLRKIPCYISTQIQKITSKYQSIIRGPNWSEDWVRGRGRSQFPDSLLDEPTDLLSLACFPIGPPQLTFWLTYKEEVLYFLENKTLCVQYPMYCSSPGF